MKTLNINVQATLFDQYSELTEEDNELVNKALDACQNAYAPYSGFQVGAAIRMADNTIITGNNQENAAYPSGLCAERVAMFYANAQKPDMAISAIAVVAKNKHGVIEEPVAPCGACRQVLLQSELRSKQPFAILLAGKSKVIKVPSQKDLLPFTFTGEGLELGKK